MKDFYLSLKKFFAYFLLSLFTFSMFLGIWDHMTGFDFIAYNSDFQVRWSNVFAIFMTILSIYSLFKMKKMLGFSLLKAFLTSIGFLFIVPAMTKQLTEHSFPYLFHSFSSTKEITKQVSFRKLISYKCKNAISLVEFESLSNGTICNVPNDVRTNLKKGDKIIIYGNGSSFGFKVKVFKYKFENKEYIIKLLNDTEITYSQSIFRAIRNLFQ